MLFSWRSVKLIALLVAFTLAGCSSNNIESAVAAANSANIKRVGNLYGSYAVHNGGQGPKNEEDLKRYAKEELSDKKLGRMGIDPQNFDAVFVSERDKKPFKVKWGLPVPGTSSVLVVFESEGTGGHKQVANTDGQVREVDDAEYQRLLGEKAASSPAAVPTGAPEASKGTSK